MNTVPVLVILGAAVALGLYLLLLYLRGRRKPVLIGFHLLLGLGGLETLVMLLHGTPDGAAAPKGALGQTAAVFLFVAAIAGLSAALLRRFRLVANFALMVHAGVASVGFLLVLYWVSGP
jgi:hypothetical protein